MLTFLYPSIVMFVLGTQKNCLIKTLLVLVEKLNLFLIMHFQPIFHFNKFFNLPGNNLSKFSSSDTGLPLNILFKIPWLFPDFRPFSRPFERPILAIFIHQQFENFVQIFMHADLNFNEKSQTINIRKGMFLKINCLAIYVQKHFLSNIACNLWKIKFLEAS